MELTSRERVLRAIRREEVDRVPVSPRYFDYLLGTEGCECILHCLKFREQYEHELMPPYRPPQNNYLLHHTGPCSDLPGVTLSMETEEAGDTLVVRRRFSTPAGVLTDVRSVVRPGSTVVFDHVIEPPVKSRLDVEKLRFLLPSPDEAYTGERQSILPSRTGIWLDGCRYSGEVMLTHELIQPW